MGFFVIACAVILIVIAICNVVGYAKGQKLDAQYQKNHPPIVRY